MANEFVIKNGYLSRGDSEITGSLIVTGGITGSLFGTASWAENVTTASYAVTSSLPLEGIVTASSAGNEITFTKGDGTSFALPLNTGSVDFATSASYSETASYVNPLNQNVIITGSVEVLNGNVNIESNSYFFQGTSVGGNNVSLIGVNSSDQIYIGNQGFTNIIADDTIISGSLIVNEGITGSLFGTASWAENAVTSSYTLTAETASYVDLVAGPNITINQIGTSFEISGSGGSTFPYTGSAIISGSLNVIGDTTLNGAISFKTYRLTSSAYTASVDDYRIGVKYTLTGSVEIQLPLIATAGEIEYKFKDEEGNAQKNNITIIASGSNLIDGDINAIMNRNYMAIGLYNDGVSNWFVE